MLIEYPNNNWETFLTETEADSFIAGFVDSGEWNNFTVKQKEQILIMTADTIRLCNKIVLPDTNERDLKLGQGYLILQAARTDITSYDHNGEYVLLEKVGDIEQKYSYGNRTNLPNDITPMAAQYLSLYGCRQGGSFTQNRAVKA